MASWIRSTDRDAGGEGVHGGDVGAGAGVIDRGRHNSLRQVLQHINPSLQLSGRAAITRPQIMPKFYFRFLLVGCP